MDTTTPAKSLLVGPVAAAGSWLGIVAATTLGLGEVAAVAAEVCAERGALEGEYRLIVQSYQPEAMDEELRPCRGARPLGSMQRAVSSDELRAGLRVNVIQVDAAGMDEDAVVVAWVERGEANLDFDAREARPGANAAYGVGQQRGSVARVVLRQRRAA